MPLDLMNPTELATPAFVFFVLMEMFYGWKTGRVKYESKDMAVSMIMGVGSTIAPLLIVGGFGLVSSYYVWDNYRLFDLGHTWPVFVLAFVLDDFKYYWVHRFGHTVRWMWAAHIIHHSSQHYNLSTALRQTWTSRLTPAFILALPIFILGIEPAIVFFVAGINLIYQFWIHTEAIDKMPRWFEAVMNTPSHHRVHHANNPRYLDSNYAGVFIIWDKMFNTFIPEESAEPPRYGLVQDLATFNPLRVALHEWVGIIKDMWAAKGIKNKIMFLVAAPGWTPDGSRMTSDMLKEKWRSEQSAQAELQE